MWSLVGKKQRRREYGEIISSRITEDNQQQQQRRFANNDITVITKLSHNINCTVGLVDCSGLFMSKYIRSIFVVQGDISLRRHESLGCNTRKLTCNMGKLTKR